MKGKTVRQRSALERLENQLITGKKKTKEGDMVDLNENDIKRIKQEIETLKQRI